MMRRLMRTVKRTYRRITRSLRVAYINYLVKQSVAEIERLREMRIDLAELESVEHFYQVQLSVRRQQIERGHA